MKTAIFVSDVNQTESLSAFLATISDEERKLHMIVALGADVEFELEERNISFQSGQDLRSTSHHVRLLYVRKFSQKMLNDSTFSFFSYKGINLLNTFMLPLQSYLILVLYFTDVFTTLVRNYPEHKKLILFSNTRIVRVDTSSVLAPLEASAVVDVARLVGEKYNLEIVVKKPKAVYADLLNRVENKLFNLKRLLFGWALSILNIFVNIIVSKKRIRILTADYWRNISPMMAELPEVEVFMHDRKESLRAGFAAILKHRMHFVHIENFASRGTRKTSLEQRDSFLAKWQRGENKNSTLQQAEFCGLSLFPILSTAVHKIFEIGGKRAVYLIDGTYSMFEKIEPDIIFVRASASAQIHFPILCGVARALGIPSIEAQHGIFYLGEYSLTDRYSSEYIATYGPLASDEVKELGYTDKTSLNVGSPRFDVYKELRKPSAEMGTKEKPITITCVIPAVLPYSWSDTYEVVDYFANLAAAISNIPNVQVIFKLRPTLDDKEFYERIVARYFASIPHKIARHEPIIDIFTQSDIVVAIYSTTLLEALMSGRPVIYNGTLAMHKALAEVLGDYISAGAFIMIKTEEELSDAIESLVNNSQKRELLAQKASNFMKENYSFDGKASSRLADILRRLADS